MNRLLAGALLGQLHWDRQRDVRGPVFVYEVLHVLLVAGCQSSVVGLHSLPLVVAREVAHFEVVRRLIIFDQAQFHFAWNSSARRKVVAVASLQIRFPISIHFSKF